jgi:hypothetical protein
VLTWILIGAGAAGLIALISYFDGARVVRRKLRRAPITPIDAVAEETDARIVGVAHVLDDKILQATFSGRPCLLCIATVELDHQTSSPRGGSSTSWRTAAVDRRGVRFVVDDGSGRARIDPTHVELALDDDRHHGETARRGEPPAAVARLLRDNDVKFGSHHVRWHETILAPDRRVSIYGRGVRSVDPQPTATDYRSAATWLEMSGTTKRPLLVSDDPEVTRQS